MKNIYCFYMVIFLLIFSACNSENKKMRSSEGVHSIAFFDVPNATLPSLYVEGKKLYFSWVDTVSVPGKARLSAAEIKDTTLVSKVSLATGEDWFINWADYPTIAVRGENMLTHFLQNHPGATKMAYNIKIAVQNKVNPVTDFRLLNTDGTASEHGFVSMLPLNDTTFFVTWLDGRNIKGGHNHNHSNQEGAMNVRSAEIDLKGNINNEVILDHMACTCCQTTATLTSNGPVVLYRDCTIDNIRDIVITRRIGDRWTEPRPIHLDGWKIAGCPVNGPKADAIDSAMVVAWYTGAGGKAKVNVSFSRDAGATFSEPTTLSKAHPLGRVDVKMIDPHRAIVSWMESDAEQTFLYAQTVADNGKLGEAIKIHQLSSNRKSGFPQMEIVDDKLYFAWTDLGGINAGVRIAYMALKTL